jgi:hypothetical protein
MHARQVNPKRRASISLVGTAFSRLAPSRPCALIGWRRGSAIGGILEAETAKSSRGARRTFLATRINALPTACFYRAPRIINGVSRPRRSKQRRKRQSGNCQFSHAVPSPHSNHHTLLARHSWRAGTPLQGNSLLCREQLPARSGKGFAARVSELRCRVKAGTAEASWIPKILPAKFPAKEF